MTRFLLPCLAALAATAASALLNRLWLGVGTYGKVGGRVFSTALCALGLESACRYPTFR